MGRGLRSVCWHISHRGFQAPCPCPRSVSHLSVAGWRPGARLACSTTGSHSSRDEGAAQLLFRVCLASTPGLPSAGTLLESVPCPFCGGHQGAGCVLRFVLPVCAETNVVRNAWLRGGAPPKPQGPGLGAAVGRSSSLLHGESEAWLLVGECLPPSLPRSLFSRSSPAGVTRLTADGRLGPRLSHVACRLSRGWAALRAGVHLHSCKGWFQAQTAAQPQF